MGDSKTAGDPMWTNPSELKEVMRLEWLVAQIAGFPDEWGITPLVYQHFLTVLRQWRQVFNTIVGDGQLRVFASVQPRLVMVIVCTHLRTWLGRGLDHGRPAAPRAEPAQAEGGGESV